MLNRLNRSTNTLTQLLDQTHQGMALTAMQLRVAQLRERNSELEARLVVLEGLLGVVREAA